MKLLISFSSVASLLAIFLVVILSFAFLPTITAFGYDTDEVTVSTVNVYSGMNVTNLSQLGDTNVPTPSDDEVLTWDDATNMWIAQAISDGTDTGNASWNQTLADSLYASAGAGNVSWNQSHADDLYADISIVSNPFDQDLNTSDNVEFQNLTLGQQIVFALGETIDNIINNWIRITGNLNVTGELNVGEDSYFNGTLYPSSSLTFDIGSGANRWSVLYVSNVSSDYLDATYGITSSGNITTTEYFIGDGTYLTNVPGGNASFNETYTDDLYADIIWGYNMIDGTGTGNASWNETYAAILYVNVSGDTMTGNLSLGGNEITNFSYLRTYGYSGGSGYLSYIASLESTNSLILYSGDASDNVTSLTFYGNKGLEYSATSGSALPFYPNDDAEVDIGKLDKRWKNIYLSGNVTADYYFGDGSQLTNILGGNASFNETHANTLYSSIDWNYNQTYIGGTYNVTYDKWSYNQSDGTGTGNASWNETHANTLYSSIDWNYNQSGYWNNMDTINATQMEDNNGVLNILVTWFETLFNSLFEAKDTDSLTQGSTNFYDNQSWNKTYADTLYSGAGGNASWNETHATTLYSSIDWNYNQTYIGGTYNVTYDKWSYNQSTPYDDFNYNQTYTDGTYNSTYDALVTFPGYDNIAMTNISETFTQNVTFNEAINFSGGGYIYDNSTALILGHT